MWSNKKNQAKSGASHLKSVQKPPRSSTKSFITPSYCGQESVWQVRTEHFKDDDKCQKNTQKNIKKYAMKVAKVLGRAAPNHQQKL